MPNTVFGPYVSHNWVAGDSANQTRLNNLESQASDALHGFNPDLIGAGFVYSGVTCTKDGTVANQLDIAAGRAYVLLSDGTVGLIVVGADNTHTTSTINTTYFLDLNPDGTWSWGTSHSAVTNHLTICSATTDASGNISTVTDARVLIATLFPNAIGPLAIPAALQINNGLQLYYTNTGGSSYAAVYKPLNATAAQTEGHVFQVWNGSSVLNALSVGSANPGASSSYITDSGAVGKIAGQATAGSFGVPVIVAQAVNTHVTTNTLQTILSFTPGATGRYRVSVDLIPNGSGANDAILLGIQWHDPNLNISKSQDMIGIASGSVVSLTGVNTGHGVPVFPVPASFYADATAPIVVSYQNNVTTPNDFISVSIERLA